MLIVPRAEPTPVGSRIHLHQRPSYIYAGEAGLHIPGARAHEGFDIQDHLGLPARLDGDLGWLYQDRASAAGQLDVGGRVDLDGVRGVQAVLPGHAVRAVDGALAMALDRHRQIPLDRHRPIAPHRNGVIGADGRAAVVLHLYGLVLLGLDEDLLRALLVLEPELVEIAGR